MIVDHLFNRSVYFWPLDGDKCHIIVSKTNLKHSVNFVVYHGGFFLVFSALCSLYQLKISYYFLLLFQGNDQVRFELTCYSLYPEVKVTTACLPSCLSFLYRLDSFSCLSQEYSVSYARSSPLGGCQNFITVSEAERTSWSMLRYIYKKKNLTVVVNIG